MSELLNILKQNARTSVEDIAKMTRSTPDAVRAQIAEYEKNGTIRGYRTLVHEDHMDETVSRRSSRSRCNGTRRRL